MRTPSEDLLPEKRDALSSDKSSRHIPPQDSEDDATALMVEGLIEWIVFNGCNVTSQGTNFELLETRQGQVADGHAEVVGEAGGKHTMNISEAKKKLSEVLRHRGIKLLVGHKATNVVDINELDKTIAVEDEVPLASKIREEIEGLMHIANITDEALKTSPAVSSFETFDIIPEVEDGVQAALNGVITKIPREIEVRERRRIWNEGTNKALNGSEVLEFLLRDRRDLIAGGHDLPPGATMFLDELLLRAPWHADHRMLIDERIDLHTRARAKKLADALCRTTA